jgi:hypothetical protein
MRHCIALKAARVAELADALDLGSSGQPWGFESPLSHHEEGHIRSVPAPEQTPSRESTLSAGRVFFNVV